MSITLYECPVWAYGITSLDWTNANEMPSAPAMHAIDNDQASFTGGSGITSTSRLAFQYATSPTVSPEDACLVRWIASSSGITHIKFYVEDIDAPGETEVVYSTVYGDGAWVSAGIRADNGYNVPGAFLATFDAVSLLKGIFRIGFVGSGTMHLAQAFPLKSLSLLGPVNATQEEMVVGGLDAERTLTGILRVTSKGLLIRSRFTLQYENMLADERDRILTLYRTCKGRVFPIGLLFGQLFYMVRFGVPPTIVEENAGLYTMSLELEEI